VAAIVSTGVVGALGVGFAGWNSARDRESREREAKADRDHAARMAHDERTGEARRAFFIEVAVWLNAWRVWISKMAGQRPADVPSQPGRPEQDARMAAQMTVFGTPELDGALKDAMSASRVYRGHLVRFATLTKQSSADPTRSREAFRAGSRTTQARDEAIAKITTMEDLIRSLLAPPS
jgi:hypothetical protein